MHFVESTTLLYISEVLSDWAERRFQMEMWVKSEAGGAYCGGVFIEKRLFRG